MEEEPESDDVLDDWFFESLKTYKDLHVYQLDFPSRVIEWTSAKTVCVAGFQPSAANEILELRLPLKLLADENKGLCAERDFKVLHGGFADGPVCGLAHVPGTRCVVTNDGRSSDLQVWDLGGDDGDVVRRTGSIAGRHGGVRRGSSMAARASHVLHGAESSGVRLSQLTSGQTLYQLATDSDDPLESLHFVSEHVFIAACCDGGVYVVDTRAPAAPRLSPPPACPGDDAVRWWTDAAGAGDGGSCRVLRVSSGGLAAVSDLRIPGRVARQARLDVRTRRRDLDHVRVSWAPALDGRAAVSGFDGDVAIYDTSAWGAELGEAAPLFRHRGHAVSSPQRGDGGGDGAPVVTCHAWHPERTRTLLSAASDGSAHVWDWVDQSGASG